MTFTLKELADLTSSTLRGGKDCLLKGVASLDDAGEGDISFVSNSKYKKMLNNSKASAVILTPELAQNYKGNVLINDDPYLTFAKAVKIFHPSEKTLSAVHASAKIPHDVTLGSDVYIAENVVIDEGVIIGQGVIIGAGCYIGKNTQLGRNVKLHSNVTLYSDTRIGSNSIIHSGVVIGADGFGYAPQKDKTWYKILQVGNVVIGNDVEVGANTTIDRAALGSTQIGNGVKIDNQIQIGHNVKIGEHSIFAAGTLIAGSTEIGAYCQVAGAVAIAGHLNITDNVIITGKTMVIKSIDKAGVYSSGIAADENKKWRRNAIRFGQLDEMAKTIKKLESKILTLEEGQT